MERKVDDKYTSLEYNTILSIIYNIFMGLKTIKQYPYVDKKILENLNKHLIIIEKYYNELMKLKNFKKQFIELSSIEIKKIETVFEIEYEYKEVVVNIWQRELTDINNLDSAYKVLAHMCRDEDDIDYIINTFKRHDIRCVSASILTNKELKTFCDGKCSFGFLYDISMNNFLGACEADAQLEQTIDTSQHTTKHSFCTVKRDDKHCVNSTVYTYSNNYQMTLTKTPYNLLNPFKLEGVEPYYNEVGIDKLYSIPKAIIYFSEMNPSIEDKVQRLSQLLELPVIRMKQYDEIDNNKRFK